MKNSLKQLLRTPMKALLFFLLLTAGTALFTVGVCLFVQTSERIANVESEFVTIATVEQKPVSTYVEEGYNDCLRAHGNELTVFSSYISADVLNFPDANYIGEPESRTSYLANWDAENMDFGYPSGRNEFIVYFSPLQDGDGTEPVLAEITKVWHSQVLPQYLRNGSMRNLSPGDIVPICQHFSETPTSLKAGKTYLSSLLWKQCPNHGYTDFPNGEMVVWQSPYTTKMTFDAQPVSGGSVPHLSSLITEEGSTILRFTQKQQFPSLQDPSITVFEVNSDDPLDSSWSTLPAMMRRDSEMVTVYPTNDLKLLPSFYHNTVKIAQGREISPEEFETGSDVCLIEDWYTHFGCSVGSQITVYFLAGMRNSAMEKQFFPYGTYAPDMLPVLRQYSLLDENGEMLSPFLKKVYAVVGTYDADDRVIFENGTTELPFRGMVVPKKSITVSDEDSIVYYAPMNAKSTSFRIPNGTIEEFDRKFHEAVPEAAELDITYYDNGYTKIMGDLNRARSTAALLLFAGAGATVSMVVLLLYFFVVKQKKRTAVERSLGMSKHQCRVSLLSGLMILVLLAVCVGTALGATSIVERDSGEVEASTYLTTFSDWKNVSIQTEEETAVPPVLFLAIPIMMWLLTLCLGLLLLGRSLRIDPIYLLSGKME
ncbi:MAG: FtsX-like permease family protein [Acutalibacter sp.]|nr:FtsX-like permease family protein [Acutalibacter sp.]